MGPTGSSRQVSIPEAPIPPSPALLASVPHLPPSSTQPPSPLLPPCVPASSSNLHPCPPPSQPSAGLNSSTNQYDWAVVSGGAPKYPTDNGGCSTLRPRLRSTLQNSGGLWLLTRNQVDPEGAAAAKAAAESLGIDLTLLRDVQQDGCVY